MCEAETLGRGAPVDTTGGRGWGDPPTTGGWGVFRVVGGVRHPLDAGEGEVGGNRGPTGSVSVLDSRPSGPGPVGYGRSFVPEGPSSAARPGRPGPEGRVRTGPALPRPFPAYRRPTGGKRTAGHPAPAERAVRARPGPRRRCPGQTGPGPPRSHVAGPGRSG